MLRRTYLQRLSALLGLSTLPAYTASGQSQTFKEQERQTLLEISSIVLPSALGKQGTASIVAKFEEYVRDYRPGADTDHGYGFTHVVPKPESPLATYAKQLAAITQPVTRASIEASLQQAQVKALPRVPDGKSVISDLMAFYFRSSDANDLCYSAAIGRDQCRGLAGSDKAPLPLRRSNS
jgi:hypothetical protein